MNKRICIDYAVTLYDKDNSNSKMREYSDSNYKKIGGLVDSDKIQNFEQWKVISNSVESASMNDNIKAYNNVFHNTYDKDDAAELRRRNLEEIKQILIDSIKNDAAREREKNAHIEDMKSKVFMLKEIVDRVDNKYKEDDISFIEECIYILDGDVSLNKRDMIILNRLYTEYCEIEKEHLEKLKMEKAQKELESELESGSVVFDSKTGILKVTGGTITGTTNIATNTSASNILPIAPDIVTKEDLKKLEEKFEKMVKRYQVGI